MLRATVSSTDKKIKLMPFFSIIIPLYNKEKYIGKTLKNVLEQSFTDFEILIINDGSTDESVKIAEQFSDFRIKIFHQENKGVSNARNRGIWKSSSNYICFLDADDEWKPHHLQSLYDLIKKYPDAGMYCNRYFFQMSENQIRKTHFINLSDDFEGYVEDFFFKNFGDKIAWTSAVCIPKKVFDEIGDFDETISSGQDLDYWIRLAIKYPVVLGKKITATYNYQLPESLSKTNINLKTLPNFDKFKKEEKANKSLKKFLDLYRVEYALHFLATGNIQKKKEFLRDVDFNNIKIKTKILLTLSPFILKKLLFLKRYLKKFGFDFSVYQ